ncbi:MAG: glycine zipper domain-containing protein [Polaromonas sp.]
MTRARAWLAGIGAGLGLLVLLGIVLVSLMPTEEELAQRLATALETSLGVPVSVGSLHWTLLPAPVVVIEQAATGQAQPIIIKRLTATLNVAALLQRRLKVDRAELDGAVLPQLSLHALDGRHGIAGAGGLSLDALPLVRGVFRDVTWISRRGNKVVYEGEVDFDPGWRPRSAQLRRPDFKPATDLTLTRLGQDERWDTRINVGGGTANGELQLQARSGDQLHLQGKLQPRGIEVASALAAFSRRSIIEGRASGETSLSASGATLAELAQSLHTTTPFTMGRSTLLRFDLDKAIRSAGKEHAGKTQLELVSGQLDTQNTPEGMVTEFSQLKARSGALSASGRARVANRHIEADLAVDLVDGVIGVPLKVSGPLEQVQVSVPAGAVAGAVAGTAVLPGIGTAIGARIGATLGKLFGGEPEGKKKLAPVEK